MHRFAVVTAFAFTIGGAACTDPPAANPLAGDWRVDRTVRAATAGCPGLTLAPLAMTLRPGFQPQVDLGSRQAGSGTITADHISFASSELAYAGTSDMLVIHHDLEIQNDDDYLMGTAVAHGDGSNLGCRWEMAAVANRTAH
jgi:hypothetical protein